MLHPGDKAPEIKLKTVEGQTIALANIWREGHNILLVFLRHLG